MTPTHAVADLVAPEPHAPGPADEIVTDHAAAAARLAALRCVPAPTTLPAAPPPDASPSNHPTEGRARRPTGRALEELRTLIDDLQMHGLDDCSDAGLVEILVAAPALAGRLTSIAVTAARIAERRQVAPRRELLSTEQLLRALGRQTRGDARLLLTCPDVLETMPGCARLFADGTLPWGVVRFLVTEARRLPVSIRTQLGAAVADDLVAVQHLDGDELVGAIGWAIVELSPEQTDDRAERAVEREYAAIMPRLDGGGAVYAEFEAVGFNAVTNAVEAAARRCDRRPEQDRTAAADDDADPSSERAGTRRSLGRLRAAGLVELATTYLGGGPGRPARPQLLLVADAAADVGSWRPDEPDTERPRPARAPLLLPAAPGQPVALPPDQARTVLADADIRVLPARNGVPRAGGVRRDRYVRGLLRDQVIARDGGCRAPGCDRPPPWCEAHHVDGDERNTRLGNVILLCKAHHDWFTDRVGWRLQLRDDGVAIFDNGRRRLVTLPLLARRFGARRGPDPPG